MPPEGRAILLVEDDPDDRFLLRKAWAEAGIENPLRMLDDGRQACDYLSGAGKYADRTSFPLPLLILLDIKMPGKSGLEVLEWLRGRETTRRVPVIVMSASTHPKDAAEAYRLGANSFVIKPSSAAELVEFASALKSYWLRFNEFAEDI